MQKRLVSLLGLAVISGAMVLQGPTAFAADTPPVEGPLGCTPEAGYSNVSDQGTFMQGVGAVQGNYNGTGGDASSTFSANASGTVGMTVNSTTTVDGSLLVAGASTSLGISLSVSLTASLGNSTTITVPAGRTGYAEYGVWRKKTSGTYWKILTNCTTQNYTGTTAWSPWFVGWNTWVS